MERVIQDLGAGVQWMRERFDRLFLIGNSGGASLMAFYAAHAERLTIKDTPAGDPIDLTQDEFPPVDGIALMAAHLGRSRLMAKQIDASVTDERDPLARDPALDIYDPAHKIPFDPQFVQQVRAGQEARIRKITAWAKARLKHLRSLPEPIQDEAFIVYRTYADPRFIDLTLDPNDRKPGGNRAVGGGDPRSGARTTNYGVNNLARYTSLTAWLSQWSPESRADGPASLAKTTIPVLNLEFTADGSIFPSDIAEWSKACKGREEFHRIRPGTHYLRDQPQLIEQAADLFTEWTNRKAAT
jgi:pimeloyl-ACP methyl ester carboxylesterase